jgi:hypothetical protein
MRVWITQFMEDFSRWTFCKQVIHEESNKWNIMVHYSSKKGPIYNNYKEIEEVSKGKFL